MAELADNQVKLSDGKIVTMREATGSDEMIVAAYLGKVYTPDTAGYVISLNCLTAACVESIGETKTQPLRDFEAYRDFIGQFKKKDWDKIKKLYDKINGDVEGNESEGKSKP